MPDQEADPIAGKGDEMLPPEGNPFDHGGNPPDFDKAVLDEWENERAQDLAGSTAGRSSRLPKPVSPEPAIDRNPAPRDPGPLPGSVFGFRPAEAISSASLPAQTETAPPEQPAPTESSPEIPIASAVQVDPAIFERIEDARWKLTDTIEDLDEARELLDNMRRIKTLLASSEPEVNEAERLLLEVEYRISLAEKAARWAAVQGRRTLWYMLAWLAAGVLLLTTVPALDISLGTSRAMTAALIGSLGGVFSALAALRRAVTRSKATYLNRTSFFVLQPVSGLMLGGFFYLVFLAFNMTQGPELSGPAVLYILSAIAGYLQNAIYQLSARANLI